MREYAIILSDTTQEDHAKLATHLKTYNEVISHESELIKDSGMSFLAYGSTQWSRYGFLPKDKIPITIDEFLKVPENRLEQALTEANHY